MNKQTIENLLNHAKEASNEAYSPYSNYPVGSAVLTKDGKIFQGCNVENVSYGLTICAERTAVVKAISEGCRDIEAIAVYSPSSNITPCGACRQFINEFGSDIDVVYMKEGKTVVRKIRELIPDVFSEGHMS